MVVRPPFLPSDQPDTMPGSSSQTDSQSNHSVKRRKSIFSRKTEKSKAISESGSASHHSGSDAGSGSQHSRSEGSGSQLGTIQDDLTYTEASEEGTSPSAHANRSDQTYGQSFTISSRFRQVIRKRGWFQILSGFILLSIVIAALVAAIIIGLRNAAIQEERRNRINSTPVITPTEKQSIVGTIRGERAQTRQFDFVIDERLGKPDGFEKDMLVVNGQYPGPIIEVNQDDLVVIRVQNMAVNTTSITWHGLFQVGTSYFDGVRGVSECGIPAGESMTYTFRPGEFSGTTYWHAGYNAQTSDGISGGFIVHPRTASNSSYDEEVVLHLSDLYHATSTDLLESYLSPSGINGDIINEPVPDSGTINGIGQYDHLPDVRRPPPSYYRLTVEAKKKYRLRLINAGSFAPIRFSVDSHNLTVIEANGVEVVPITFTGGITLYPGQRYSVELTADQTSAKAFWMRATIVNDQFRYNSPNSRFKILGIVQYGDLRAELPKEGEPSPSSAVDLNLDQLRPLVPFDPPSPTRTYLLDVGFNKAQDGSLLGLINSTAWEPVHHTTSLSKNLGSNQIGASITDSQFVISHDKAEVVELIIENFSGGNFPFTLHGHRPWVIEVGNGKYNGIKPNTGINNSTNPNPMAPVQLSPSASPLLPVLAANNGSSTAGSSTSPTSTTRGTQGSPTVTSPPVPPPADMSQGSSSQTKGAYNTVGSVPQAARAKKYQQKSLPSYDKLYRRVRRQTQSRLMHPRQKSDTFLLPKDGWIRVRFVANNPGVWLLSDQTQWHQAAGVAMQIASLTSTPVRVPDEVTKFCTAADLDD
ncbi:multi-copper oxidase laccase-like protein [Melampsora larici-populina 98AG31]|uniref:Multi-copper oxidase laccase-like protein n=1 Tax=Melampsora larici-populina (strain 98AG31 / pathotype 3-4-7) TaxID=747676 RepID=F4RNV7_MELLP|nr:multi-copper oxidase laccase-like protein [Melampsora larici-populina 98AG31]EGG05845.1 multi-copper oxidase laccase-like protein [Melampsora larici-populina 98AG31]